MNMVPIPLKMLETPPGPSAVEIQQEYFEVVGGVDWELYENEHRNLLLQKIAVAMYGPPTVEGNLELNPKDKSTKVNSKDPDDLKKKKNEDPGTNLKLQGYEPRDEEGIMKVFNKICEQAKYSYGGENVFINTLRVVCVVPKKEVSWYEITPADYWVNLHDKNGKEVDTVIFHVFRVRKCISMNTEVNGCAVYVDHDARVYQDWNSYLTENTLLKSVMVVPENGKYTGTFGKNVDLLKISIDDEMPAVKLSVVPSPALGLGATVLKITDTMGTVGGVLGIASVCAAAVPVLAPVALPAAMGIGVATGTYGIVRGSISLFDRFKHEQDINLFDAEARGHWINILVSTAGLSFSAATKIVQWAAASGANAKILINTLEILRYANLGTGVIGVANSLGDMIYKYTHYNESPSKLEIFQFTTSLLFLGVGAMSNQTAQEIVQDAQANRINEVRDGLSSNAKRLPSGLPSLSSRASFLKPLTQLTKPNTFIDFVVKKMFDKVTAETRRLHGAGLQGNAEVIQALNKIENKDEFFGKLRGMNKQFNKNKLRISLSTDGNPLINNSHNVDVSKLQTLGKSGRDQLFAKYGPAKINSKNVPTRVTTSSANINTTGVQQNSNQCYVRPEEIVKIINLVQTLSKLELNTIAEILSDFSQILHDAVLLICAEFIASFGPDEIAGLNLDRHYKIRIIMFIFDTLKSQIEVDYSNSNVDLTNILKRYLKHGRIPKETILQLKTVFFDRISSGRKLYNDPRIFDIMHEYDKRFVTLQVGETLKIGPHDIIIKNNTTENLNEWLLLFAYTQSQSDMLINLCFEIISLLSKTEMSQLNEINNPDDDVVKLISYFLIFVKEELYEFLVEDFSGSNVLADFAFTLKFDLMVWCTQQDPIKFVTCKICKGKHFNDA